MSDLTGMEQNAIMDRMQKLISTISAANAAYYGSDMELMPNHAYDRLVCELEDLEESTGIHLDSSPIGKVGYAVVSELKKSRHLHPALSLDKTKLVEDLIRWMRDFICVLAWKLDGLTCVLTYQDGNLVSAVTRGDGIIGEDVTHNVKYIRGIPLCIAQSGCVEVRGEVTISYKDFEQINDQLPVDQDKYANPRNLASSSLRMLDSKKARRRFMRFAAFEWVDALSFGVRNYSESLQQLQMLGFDVVDHLLVQGKDQLMSAIRMFESHLEDGTMIIPSDGLVLSFEDLNYVAELGFTEHHPRGMMAFKWQDEEVETKLLDVEWSASHTGLLNPVAVFEPVSLEGTTVRRASLHNVSIFRNLELGIGDVLTVYKANKIIPKVADNLTRSGGCVIPKQCPVCKHTTVFRTLGDTKLSTTRSQFLFCSNPDCPAKSQGMFLRMVGRDGLNVRGMGAAAIEQFVSYGWLRKYSDLFYLENHRCQMLSLDGFDSVSVDKLLASIRTSRETTFQRFFYSLGIPGCGHDVGRILEHYFTSPNCSLSRGTKLSRFFELVGSEDAVTLLSGLDGIGSVTASSIVMFYQKHKLDIIDFCNLLLIMDNDLTDFTESLDSVKKDLIGLTFVITGKLQQYASRDVLKAEIESRGGVVAGSVSGRTNYLICNDENSSSSKVKKAVSLGVSIISEDDYKKI